MRCPAGPPVPRHGAAGRYVEYFVDGTWVEHLRRHEWFTADDIQLREHRLAFHLGGAAPAVRRYVGDSLGGAMLRS